MALRCREPAPSTTSNPVFKIFPLRVRLGAASEIHAPANRPIVLRIRNLDAAPIEFESVSLRVEKIIAANSQGIINLKTPEFTLSLCAQRRRSP